MSKLHVIYIPVEFPDGVCAGEGSDSNQTVIAKDGQGQPLLRGTAVAGAIRREYLQLLEACHGNSPEAGVGSSRGEHTASATATIQAVFGYVNDQSEEAAESRIRFSDSALNLGRGAVTTRTHHQRNRHTGTVIDGGLFSIEACPPGTRATLCISYSVDEGIQRKVLNEIHSLLRKGIQIGGNKARGIGRMVALKNQSTFCRYDLSNSDDFAKYLDHDFGWRSARCVPDSQEKLDCLDLPGAENDLNLKVQFAIPRGEDLLVGDGQGSSHDVEPQRVTNADGNPCWRIPGSTFRGLFKSWFSRLAARRGLTIADSHDRYEREVSGNCETHEIGNNGENHGWAFIEKSQRNSKDALGQISCPIADLFGSFAKAGRIHVSDSYAPIKPDHEQKRVHVAIDRLTGGAAEGMLFDNTVIVGGQNSPVFEVQISIREAKDVEFEFLRDTLKAIDLGLLRVGSSKSSGRLELRNRQEVFEQFNSSRGGN